MSPDPSHPIETLPVEARLRTEKRSLVFDGSNRWLCVGLADHERFYEINLDAPRSAFALLTELIQTVLQKGGTDRPDLIICTIGPGSFTGTRIAVTAARSLAQLWSIPVYGIDSIEFYRFSIERFLPEPSPFCVMIDAKQKRVYARTNAPAQNGGDEPTLDIPPDDLYERTAPGTRFYCDDPETVRGYSKHFTESPDAIMPMKPPRAYHLYELALQKGASHSPIAGSELYPLYMRADPASLKYPDGLNRT